MKIWPRGISRKKRWSLLDDYYRDDLAVAMSVNRRLVSDYTGPAFTLYANYQWKSFYFQENGEINRGEVLSYIAKLGTNPSVMSVSNQALGSEIRWNSLNGWGAPTMIDNFAGRPRLSVRHSGTSNECLMGIFPLPNRSRQPWDSGATYRSYAMHTGYRDQTYGDSWQRTLGIWKGSQEDYTNGSWTMGIGTGGAQNRDAWGPDICTAVSDSNFPHVLKMGTNPTGGERFYGFWTEAIIWIRHNSNPAIPYEPIISNMKSYHSM